MNNKSNALWIFISIFASVICGIVVFRSLKRECHIQEQIEKNKRDSISLVKKIDATNKRIKADSLMNELIRKPYKLDSVPDSVKADYIKKFKNIID